MKSNRPIVNFEMNNIPRHGRRVLVHATRNIRTKSYDRKSFQRQVPENLACYSQNYYYKTNNKENNSLNSGKVGIPKIPNFLPTEIKMKENEDQQKTLHVKNDQIAENCYARGEHFELVSITQKKVELNSKSLGFLSVSNSQPIGLEQNAKGDQRKGPDVVPFSGGPDMQCKQSQMAPAQPYLTGECEKQRKVVRRPSLPIRSIRKRSSSLCPILEVDSSCQDTFKNTCDTPKIRKSVSNLIIIDIPGDHSELFERDITTIKCNPKLPSVPRNEPGITSVPKKEPGILSVSRNKPGTPSVPIKAPGIPSFPRKEPEISSVPTKKPGIPSASRMDPEITSLSRKDPVTPSFQTNESGLLSVQRKDPGIASDPRNESGIPSVPKKEPLILPSSRSEPKIPSILIKTPVIPSVPRKEPGIPSVPGKVSRKPSAPGKESGILSFPIKTSGVLSIPRKDPVIPSLPRQEPELCSILTNEPKIPSIPKNEPEILSVPRYDQEKTKELRTLFRDFETGLTPMPDNGTFDSFEPNITEQACLFPQFSANGSIHGTNFNAIQNDYSAHFGAYSVETTPLVLRAVKTLSGENENHSHRLFPIFVFEEPSAIWMRRVNAECENKFFMIPAGHYKPRSDPLDKIHCKHIGNIEIAFNEIWGKYRIKPGYFWHGNKCYLIEQDVILVSKKAPSEKLLSKRFIRSVNALTSTFTWLHKIESINLSRNLQNTLKLTAKELADFEFILKQCNGLMLVAEFYAEKVMKISTFTWLKLFIKYFMTPMKGSVYFIGILWHQLSEKDLVCMMDLFQFYLNCWKLSGYLGPAPPLTELLQGKSKSCSKNSSLIGNK